MLWVYELLWWWYGVWYGSYMSFDLHREGLGDTGHGNPVPVEVCAQEWRGDMCSIEPCLSTQTGAEQEAREPVTPYCGTWA